MCIPPWKNKSSPNWKFRNSCKFRISMANFLLFAILVTTKNNLAANSINNSRKSVYHGKQKITFISFTCSSNYFRSHFVQAIWLSHFKIWETGFGDSLYNSFCSFPLYFNQKTKKFIWEIKQKSRTQIAVVPFLSSQFLQVLFNLGNEWQLLFPKAWQYFKLKKNQPKKIQN